MATDICTPPLSEAIDEEVEEGEGEGDGESGIENNMTLTREIASVSLMNALSLMDSDGDSSISDNDSSELRDR